MPDRRPRWVYTSGDEPDPRFSLANERTFLAWMRTSIGVLAGAVALHTLDLPADDDLRTPVLLLILALAAGSAVTAIVRWARVERAMRLRQPLPASYSGVVLTVAIVLLAAVLAVVIVS